MKKALKIILALILIGGFVSCASTGTVKSLLDDPNFQKENLPIREIRVAVYSEGSHYRETIEEIIANASASFEKQVGIQLKIVSFKLIEWGGTSREERLETLDVASYKDWLDKKFDIAIGFGSHTVGDQISSFIVGTWLAVTDDVFRRYIVVKELTTFVVMHEVAHCFIFSHAHSDTGLMQSMMIMLFPFTPAINQTIYLSSEDRAEILKNKWRDFNKKPEIKLEDIEDTIPDIHSK